MLAAYINIHENEPINNSMYNNSFSESDIVMATSISKTSIIKPTETTEKSTIETTIIESDEYIENQIVINILLDNDLYGIYKQISVSDSANYMMNVAESLSNRYCGEITSEEDAKIKARSILINKGEIDYVERVEAVFIDVDGEKISYQRKNAPYTITYYEEYDTWLIIPNLPSGIREDGVPFDTPSSDRYIMIRGTDGKVLAIA